MNFLEFNLYKDSIKENTNKMLELQKSISKTEEYKKMKYIEAFIYEISSIYKKMK
jgi:ppGpp synthetase/RelA/SpoT-type nucleotidyltranferase